MRHIRGQKRKLAVIPQITELHGVSNFHFSDTTGLLNMQAYFYPTRFHELELKTNLL